MGKGRLGDEISALSSLGGCRIDGHKGGGGGDVSGNGINPAGALSSWSQKRGRVRWGSLSNVEMGRRDAAKRQTTTKL